VRTWWPRCEVTSPTAAKTPEAFGPAEVFAQRLAGAALVDAGAADSTDWDRYRARSLVLEGMRSDRHLDEQGWVLRPKGPLYRQHAHWRSQETPTAVLDAVAALVSDRGARIVTREPEVLVVRFGSRMAVRFFGVFMKAGRSRLPMRLRVGVRAGGNGTDVEATIADDLGWYLFGLSITTGPYEGAFSQLLDAVQAATSPDGSARIT